MSDKDTSRDETAAETGKPADEANRRPPEQYFSRTLDMFRQSLANEGETAYSRWGMCLFHSLNDEDVESQRVGLGFAPKDALDFYNQGCLLAGREDYAGAVAAFERASQLNPKMPEAVYNQALALEHLGNKTGARQLWKAWLDQFGDSDDVAEVKQHLETLAEA